jgi:hypothetical protein
MQRNFVSHIQNLCLAFCLCVVAVLFPATANASRDAAPAMFEFHSGFWINLHHFLYLEALSDRPRKSSLETVSTADAETLKSLSQEQLATWNAAVSYYVSSVIQHDLLFDKDLIAIKNQLADAEVSPDLANVDIPTALRAALLSAAPIYRQYWWKRHDAQNRQWIDRLMPLVSAHGETLMHSLVRIYDTPWPGHPVRVDATVFATWAGAYTTIRPTRPTISTVDPTNQGPAALEAVFHETTHGMMDKVWSAMDAAEANIKARGSPPDLDTGTLWHAVLFYTIGQLVADRIPGYTPYADKNGLWTRAWPAPDRSLIEQDWKPHMNDSVSLQQALTKLVDDFASAQRPSRAGARTE